MSILIRIKSYFAASILLFIGCKSEQNVPQKVVNPPLSAKTSISYELKAYDGLNLLDIFLSSDKPSHFFRYRICNNNQCESYDTALGRGVHLSKTGSNLIEAQVCNRNGQCGAKSKVNYEENNINQDEYVGLFEEVANLNHQLQLTSSDAVEPHRDIQAELSSSFATSSVLLKEENESVDDTLETMSERIESLEDRIEELERDNSGISNLSSVINAFSASSVVIGILATGLGYVPDIHAKSIANTISSPMKYVRELVASVGGYSVPKDIRDIDLSEYDKIEIGDRVIYSKAGRLEYVEIKQSQLSPILGVKNDANIFYRNDSSSLLEIASDQSDFNVIDKKTYILNPEIQNDYELDTNSNRYKLKPEFDGKYFGFNGKIYQFNWPVTQNLFPELSQDTIARMNHHWSQLYHRGPYLQQFKQIIGVKSLDIDSDGLKGFIQVDEHGRLVEPIERWKVKGLNWFEDGADELRTSFAGKEYNFSKSNSYSFPKINNESNSSWAVRRMLDIDSKVFVTNASLRGAEVSLNNAFKHQNLSINSFKRSFRKVGASLFAAGLLTIIGTTIYESFALVDSASSTRHSNLKALHLDRFRSMIELNRILEIPDIEPFFSAR